jgi:hypothetical protein
MCFFKELNIKIEEFIKETNYNKNIINNIYNAENDINELFYSNENSFDTKLENIFNKYFLEYDEIVFEKLLIHVYNIYLINKIKINNYYCSTYNIKNINIEDK